MNRRYEIRRPSDDSLLCVYEGPDRALGVVLRYRMVPASSSFTDDEIVDDKEYDRADSGNRTVQDGDYVIEGFWCDARELLRLRKAVDAGADIGWRHCTVGIKEVGESFGGLRRAMRARQ